MARALTTGGGGWCNATRRALLLLVASAGALAACGGGESEPAHSTNINTSTLAWDPVADPNLGGYRIYYGTGMGMYLQPYGKGVGVGNVTTYAVMGLGRGTRYYFAVTAYDTMGNESDYSNEVFKDIP